MSYYSVYDGQDAIASAVRSLAATVGWVERRLLHAEQDVPPAPLDATDETLQRLAERARQGRQSAAVLLDPTLGAPAGR